MSTLLDKCAKKIVGLDDHSEKNIKKILKRYTEALQENQSNTKTKKTRPANWQSIWVSKERGAVQFFAEKYQKCKESDITNHFSICAEIRNWAENEINDDGISRYQEWYQWVQANFTDAPTEAPKSRLENPEKKAAPKKKVASPKKKVVSPKSDSEESDEDFDDSL